MSIKKRSRRNFRDGESIRDWMHTRFVEQLQNDATPVVHLTGPPEQRTEQAISALTRLLAHPFDL